MPHIDLQTILRGGLSQKMIQQNAPVAVKSESMDVENGSGPNLEVKTEPFKNERKYLPKAFCLISLNEFHKFYSGITSNMV